MAGLVAEADGSYLVDDRVITMPVEVRSARQAASTFIVDHSAAQRVIDHTGLRAARKANKAIASLALVDYLDNDLDTYFELALAFVIDDPAVAPTAPKGAVSTLIHRLPVSEKFTCSAGKGIWGFPKWIADLKVSFDSLGASCVLRDGDIEIVRVTMKRGFVPLPRKPMEMVAYSCDDDGVVRRTPWVTTGDGRQKVRLGGAKVEVGYGHPLADELRTLGLPRRAAMTFFDDHMRATFQAPQIIEV